jgi:16S rRNA (guanine966-N2)-methyltransferase
MREAVFSSLGVAVADAAVLDLYAGSGSFGLEALSRGAASATFVERDEAALQALRINVDKVGLGGRVLAADVAVALERETGPFDLVFVDPPYALASSRLESILAALTELIAEGGIVVLHRRRDEVEAESPGTLELTGRRRYGDSEIWWYEKEAQ